MKKIEEKPPKNHTNSLKTTDNNGNSYSANSHQEEQGSDYKDGAMLLKNEDKNTATKPDPMKRFDNITDSRVLRKRKQKTYAEATKSDLVECKIVDISPNVEKVDAESGKRSFDLEAIKKNLLSAAGSKFLILHLIFVSIHICPITPPILFLRLLRLSQFYYLHKTWRC